jgi:glycosyltransferase involved in cell wall biosynthesis
MTGLSCVIPAYNEGERIRNVLKAVVGHPLIDEVIVIDDGSADDTCAATREFPSVRLLTGGGNCGKSQAIAKGIAASSGAHILMLDADLVGLSPQDITALVEPVTSGDAEFSISLRCDALLPWKMIGLDYLSGERVLARALIAGHLDTIAGLPGFGLETYLNSLVIKSRARVRVVKWQSVGHTYKIRKYGIWKGFLGEIRMLMNIVETLSLIRTGRQILALHRARNGL